MKDFPHAEHYIQGLNPASGPLAANLLAELRGSRALKKPAPSDDTELLALCRRAAQDVFQLWQSQGIDPNNPAAVTAFYQNLDLYCFELIGFEIDTPTERQAQLLAFRDLLQERQKRSGSPLRGLDYGCGVGTTGLYLQAHGLSCDFADVSRPNLTFVRERLARRRFDACRVIDLNTEVPAKDSYDFVLAFDVLEHVANPVEVLKTLISYLRPGGVILFNLVVHHEEGSPHILNDAYLLRKVIRAFGTRLVGRVGEFKVYEKVMRPAWANRVIGRIDEWFWSYRARRDARRREMAPHTHA